MNRGITTTVVVEYRTFYSERSNGRYLWPGLCLPKSWQERSEHLSRPQLLWLPGSWLGGHGTVGTAGFLKPLCVVHRQGGLLAFICKTCVWGSPCPAVILSLMESSCNLMDGSLVLTFDVCWGRGYMKSPGLPFPAPSPRGPSARGSFVVGIQWHLVPAQDILLCETPFFFFSCFQAFSKAFYGGFCALDSFFDVFFPLIDGHISS